MQQLHKEKNFITAEINNIMQALPPRVVITGLVVLCSAVLLMALVAFKVTIPVMLPVAGVFKTDSLLDVTVNETDIHHIQKGQRALVTTINTDHKAMTAEGSVTGIDKDSHTVHVALYKHGALLNTLNKTIAFVSIEINRLPLIDKIRN